MRGKGESLKEKGKRFFADAVFSIPTLNIFLQ